MGSAADITESLPDRYAVIRELGRGGSAVVYLAEDKSLERPVAIKVLRPELSQSIWRNRFLQEIKIEANLQHPNILPIFDSGEADGALYYTMPYVEGESLGDRIKREGQLSVQDTLTITKEVAEALSQAHERGIVHRDIKPGNILLSKEHAVVADFGIARAFTAAGAEPLTKDTATLGTPTGVAIGTPEYMSPEQVSGDTAVDGRSDQYALACVVFEMLAGDPPFTGRTMQSVINRQISEPPPELGHRRAKAPPHVALAVDRALSKVPADRFPTMEAFVRALETPVVPKPKLWKVLAATAAIAVTGAVVYYAGFRGRDLDPNRIVVYPVRDVGASESGTGHRVATTLGWVLEGTNPLRWVRGRDFLSPDQVENPSLLSVSDAARIARQRHAQFFIDGDILRENDSITVVLRLFQTGDDTPIASSGESGPPGSSEPQLGAQAMIDLVSEIVAPGRPVDKAGLSLRNTAAITNFLLGEEEYRRSHFSLALGHYSNAVASDSLFSLAAIRGAQAANWLEEADRAEALTAAALQHDSLLPPHYSRFARGLASYFEGSADSAEAQLRAALGDRDDWPEAWMALSEVYYHLLPDAAPLDSLAEFGFLRARELDSLFSAPLYHLIEISIRRGELERADSLMQIFSDVRPDSTVGTPIDVTRRCLGGSPSPEEWRELAATDHAAVFEASHTFANSRHHRQCAHDGFRAILDMPSERFEPAADEARYKFAAKYALQGMLTAEGRYEDVRRLYEDDPAGPWVVWQDALEIDEFVPDASDLAASRGEDYLRQGPTALWLLGIWESKRGSGAIANEIATRLSAIADSTANREHRLWADIVRAHATLASGDTLAAMRLFYRLRPVDRRPVIGWGIYEALGLERLTLARLLLARGEYEEAIRIASAFDSPQPISFLLYRRQSLELRIEAAEALGDTRLVERCREELAGWQGSGRNRR